MSPSEALTQKIAHTVKDLPYDRQREVYDFAAFLKTKGERRATRRSSLSRLVGLIEGPSDLADKHDEIYD